MKKRIIPILLALTMLLAMLPAPTLAAPTTPGLVWENADETDKEHPKVPSTHSYNYADTAVPVGCYTTATHPIVLYLDTGSGPSPVVNGSFLTVSNNDLFSLESVDSANGVYELRGKGKTGSGTINYDDGKGNTYSLTVNVELPSLGLYYNNKNVQDKTLVPLNVPISETPTTFYLCPGKAGITIDSVTTSSGNWVTIGSKNTEGHFPITIGQDYNGEDKLALHVTYTENGQSSNEDLNYRLEVMRQSLVWATPDYNNGKPEVPKDHPDYRSDTIFVSCSGVDANVIALYFDAGTGNALVTDDVSVSAGAGAPFTIEALKDASGLYELRGTGETGSGTIVYTDADNKTYTLNVEARLPELGFYKNQTPNSKDLITAVDTKDLPKTVYMCVAPYSPLKIVDGEAENMKLPQGVTCKYVNQTTLEVTIGKGATPGGVFFNITFTDDKDDNSFQRGVNLDIKGKALFWCWADRDKDGPKVPDHPKFDNGPIDISCQGFDDSLIVLFFDDGTGKKELVTSGNNVSLSADAPFKLEKADAVKGVYGLRGEGALGKGQLEYTDGSDAYKLDVDVTLPDLGFYKNQSAVLQDLVNMIDANSLPPTLNICIKDGVPLEFDQGEIGNMNTTLPSWVTCSYTDAKTLSVTINAGVTVGPLHIDAPVIDTSNNNKLIRTARVDIKGKSLRWCWAIPGHDGPELPNDPSSSFNNWTLNTLCYDTTSNTIALYLDGGDGGPVPVTGAKASANASFELVPVERVDGVYELRGNKKTGSGTIDYTADGNTYSLHVDARLPRFGLYKASTPVNADMLLPWQAEVRLPEETFYFCLDPDEKGVTIDSVSVKYGNWATAEAKDEYGHYPIEINENYDGEEELILEVTYTDGHGSNTEAVNFGLRDMRPGLVWCWLEGNSQGGLTIPSEPEYNSRPIDFWFHSDTVFGLFLYDGKNYTPVTTGVTVTDASGNASNSPVDLNTIGSAGSACYELYGKARGQGYLKYTDDKGNVYKLPIVVRLPFAALYSSDTKVDETTYLPEAPITSLPQTFYLCLDPDTTGKTITSVSLNGTGFDQWVEVGEINSNGHVPIEIKSGYAGQPLFELRVQGTQDGGHNFDENCRLWLRDMRPGLVWCWLDGDADQGFTLPQDPHYDRQPISMHPGNGVPFALYYFDGTDYKPVTTDGASLAAAPYQFNVIDGGKGWYELVSDGQLGNGKLEYTVSGQKYELDVETFLPEIGFCSSPTLSKDTFLTSVNVGTSHVIVYLCLDQNVPLTIDEDRLSSMQLPNWAQCRYVDSKTLEVTILEGAPNGNLHIALPVHDSHTNEDVVRHCDLRIRADGLVYRILSSGQSGFTENQQAPARPVSDIFLPLDTPQYLALYYRSGNTLTPINDANVSGLVVGEQLSRSNASYPNNWYKLYARGITGGMISYSLNGENYAEGVNVSDPKAGLYDNGKLLIPGNVERNHIIHYQPGGAVELTLETRYGIEITSCTSSNSSVAVSKTGGVYVVTLPANTTGVTEADITVDVSGEELYHKVFHLKFTTDEGAEAPIVMGSRGYVARFLWRRAGKPTSVPYRTTLFSDVSANAGYSTAVPWCLAGQDGYGYIHGYGDSFFYPDQVLTRAQLAAILFWAADLREETYNGHDPDPNLEDDLRQHWAYTYICWAIANDMMKAKEPGKFSPDAEIVHDDVIYACKNHQWDSGVVVTAATATADGVMRQTCSICEGTKDSAIPATGVVTPPPPSAPSDSTTTSTTTNDDGSTTTTVTDKTTGTVTETTTKTDGTKIETVTEATTGTVTETTTKTDGTTVKTETKKDGASTTEETRPDGVAVMTSTTASSEPDSEGATTAGVTTASITIPPTVESATVTIPAPVVTPGTVAVIVHEDGTEEVVRGSIPRKDGVELTVDESVQIKIIDNAKSFDDVPEDSWFDDAVAFVSGHELFHGTDTGTFDPDASMTRGMLVTVLYQAMNEPDSVGESFGDVDGGKYYSDAVSWAAENGIVSGYADGSFGPEDSITREQLATILYRWAGCPDVSGSLSGFNDAGEVSGYAEAAMRWAVEQGLLHGRGGGVLDPTGSASRAEVAAVIMRYLSK